MCHSHNCPDTEKNFPWTAQCVDNDKHKYPISDLSQKNTQFFADPNHYI